jgi:hypothetical protein
MFVDRSKLNNYTIDLGDTKVIWHHFTPLIVPEEFSLTEERYLLASQQTLFCGNTSVDNILKSQFADYETQIAAALQKHKDNVNLRKIELVSKTLKEAKKVYTTVYDSLKGLDFSSTGEAHLVCEMIFLRLHSGFKACRFLIKYGYYFETYAIQRQILEQLAFAYHVSNHITYDDFLQPPSCIKQFKNFYPSVGTLYGLLSNRTHIDKTQIKLFRIRNENDEVQTIINSLDYSLETMYDFLRLLDIYCCTFEYCFRNQLSGGKLTFITKKSHLKRNRITRSLGESYRKRYLQILETP